ncbi:MAG: surface polysaccharide biosynthesis protein [Pedosphaera sp.]|nr:surface polysaccharide biosynthesis protein [Pedosphaera sp.]
MAEGWNVVAMVRHPSPEEVRAKRAIEFRLGGDISPEQLAGADALVHCAYDFAPRDEKSIQAINVVGSEKLFRAAHEAGVKKRVFISSMSAFAGCQSLYGQAKLEIERVVLPLGALVLRPGLIYGDEPRGIFGKLVQRVANSRIVPLFGDGSQIQYLSHQEDLGRVIYEYADGRMGWFDQPMTAAHERGWTFREILEELGKAQGKQLRFVKLPWWLVWLGIKSLELLRLPLEFRSDSLIGLIYSNPRPSFGLTRRAALGFRPFEAGNLKL